MTLINCRECEKEVSTEAENCPHCGHPIKSSSILVKKNWKNYVGLLLITILFFALIYISVNRIHQVKEQVAIKNANFTFQNVSIQNQAIATTKEITTASITEKSPQNSESLQLKEIDKKAGVKAK